MRTGYRVCRRRRGYAVMELMVVITAGTVIFGLSLGVLHALVKADSANRRGQAEGDIRAALAQQFREDARAAVAVPSADGLPRRCRFAIGEDRAAEYSCEPGQVLREEFHGEKLLRRETYYLGEGHEAAIRLIPTEQPTVAALEIASGAGRGVPVEARLGKDHRYEISKTEKP